MNINWINVKDRMPDKSGYYIVCWNYESAIVSGEVWYEGGHWIHPHYGGDEKENPLTLPEITHWMPMPLPPIGATVE